jgi:hypothetical protein
MPFGGNLLSVMDSQTVDPSGLCYKIWNPRPSERSHECRSPPNKLRRTRGKLIVVWAFIGLKSQRPSPVPPAKADVYDCPLVGFVLERVGDTTVTIGTIPPEGATMRPVQSSVG